MVFYMTHGRVDNGPPQSLAKDGTATVIDDWGFDGPRLPGVIGFHCTYGVDGYWNLYFDTPQHVALAQAATGWQTWHDLVLTVEFSDDNSLVKIRDPVFDRYHYFGDWGIK